MPTFANSPNIAFLSLSDNAFTGSIPSQWGSLQSLETLYLGKNKLTGEVPSFSQTQLCQFYIQQNAFTFADILPNDLANRTRIANCNSGGYFFDPQANIDSVRGASVGATLSVNYKQHPNDQIQWYRGQVGSETEITGATGTSYTPTASGTYFYQVKNPTLPPSGSTSLVLNSNLITVSNASTFSISGEVIGNAPDHEINEIAIDLISTSANISEQVRLSQKAPFQFQNRLMTGADYRVSIAHRDNLVCTPKATTGTMQQSNIRITITCDLKIINKYTVSANVSGLPSGKVLTLSLNGGSDLTFTGTGAVLTRPFSPMLDDGSTYRVTVAQNPPNVQCVVQNPLGGKINGADVTESIICQAKAQYTLSVGVQGLEPNKTFELTNGGDILVVNGNGQKTFTQQYFDGSNYDVQVSKQPANQRCVVQRGRGSVNGTNVANVAVVCTAKIQSGKIFEDSFE